MKSIMQDEHECFICKTTENLQKHHIFQGKNRKNSDEDGLWVYLCMDHHTGRHGVHSNYGFMNAMHIRGQLAYEQTHTRQDFVLRYGKDYL